MTQNGYDLQQLKYRDQHRGGIAWEETHVSAERKVRERVRSKPDARLFDSMSVEQETAFLRIQRAHSMLNSGLGAKVQRYEDSGKVTGAGDVESGAVLMAHYKAWREICKGRGISGLMAEDVIVLGLSLRESDEGRKMRKGTAMKNLLACLEAWWDVRDDMIETVLGDTIKNVLDRSGVIRR